MEGQAITMLDEEGTAEEDLEELTLRVQVPNNHMLTQSLYYNYYYLYPKYLIIGYMDP